MKKVISFLSTLALASTSTLAVSACRIENNNEQSQELKANFELISNIEIKRTSDDKFGIRFYKKNASEKGVIPDDFWYLSNNGEYVAEFNNISDGIKKSIIDILKIKKDKYYPDFTLLAGWDLKDVTLTYKIDDNQKQMISFNANVVVDLSILLYKITDNKTIQQVIDQDWISEPDVNPKFTEKWVSFIKNNQEFISKLKNVFIDEVKKQLNLDITISDFDLDISQSQVPSKVKVDNSKNVNSFFIWIDITGKNQLKNYYSYGVTISNSFKSNVYISTIYFPFN